MFKRKFETTMTKNAEVWSDNQYVRINVLDGDGQQAFRMTTAQAMELAQALADCAEWSDAGAKGEAA